MNKMAEEEQTKREKIEELAAPTEEAQRIVDEDSNKEPEEIEEEVQDD